MDGSPANSTGRDGRSLRQRRSGPLLRRGSLDRAHRGSSLDTDFGDGILPSSKCFCSGEASDPASLQSRHHRAVEAT